MEFWGVEVKAGEPLKVKPDSDSVIHLSQAALGETKKDKGNDSIFLSVKIGDQKIVLGTLSPEKFPQLSFDVVFEKEFELSHNWKNGSVFLCGYQSPMPVDDEEGMYDSSDDDEEIPILNADNGKPEAKVEALKPVAAAKPKAKNAESTKAAPPAQESKDSDDEDDSDDDAEDSEDDDGVEGMSEDDEEDEDDDLDDSEDEEDTPKKVDVSKKRPSDAEAKTPTTKKAKIVTPQKSEGKKTNVHTATPHPAKKAAAASNTKQTPKSGGQFSCKSCDRSFNSDNALQSHTKAKHNK